MVRSEVATFLCCMSVARALAADVNVGAVLQGADRICSTEGSTLQHTRGLLPVLLTN